jgi:LysM repeat protein
MGSLRSLATMAILVGVGYFLYTKIDDTPPNVGPNQWDQQGIPPLDPSVTAGGTQANLGASGATDAPKWSDSGATPAPPFSPTTEPQGFAPAAPNVSAGAAMPGASASAPPVPDIPDMPALSSTPSVSTAPAQAAESTELPTSVPTARYPVEESPSPDRPSAISGRVPSLGTATPDLTAAPQAQITPPPIAPSVPEAELAGGTPPNGLASADPPSLAGAPAAATTPTPPLPPTASPSSLEEDDRYGATASTESAAMGVSTFAAGWPVIQAALERGELARAHQLLSQWYEDPSLTPAENQQVESLLGQLAGTVVYSMEHRLEPPHTVRPGETLDTIAQQYQIPWQLLAKINGITSVDGVQPGQQLKVVRGPFSAVVDLSDRQMTLLLEGRYAGKFSVDLSSEVMLPEGEWVVLEKPASPMSQASPYAPASPAVTRSLRLRNAAATDANPGVPITIGSAPAVEAREIEVGGVRTVEERPSPYLVKVAPNDADELVDILSVGSRVVIRR